MGIKKISKELSPQVFLGLLFFFILFASIFTATEYIWATAALILLETLMAAYLLLEALKNKALNLPLFSSWNKFIYIILVFLLFSLIPLPPFLLKIFSPNTYRLYLDSVPQYDNSFILPLKTMTISPYRTILAIALLLAVLFIINEFFSRFNSSSFKFKLANFIMVISTGIAMWGLVNLYIQNKKLFWFRDVISGTPTGPFINTIHFAHFMALCIPLSLGIALSHIFSHYKKNNLSKIKYFGIKLGITLKNLVMYITPIFIMIFALFRALSRGAMISFLVSMLTFFLLTIFCKKFRIKAIFIILFIIAGLMLVYFLDNGLIIDRIKTLQSPFDTQSAQIRTHVWQDTIKIIKHFPLFGTGLNAFVIAFPKYKTIFGSGKNFFTHAENDYLELFSEIGLIAGALSLFILFLFLFKAIKQLPKSIDDSRIILIIGGISSIVAIASGAFTDFVFHIPLISLFVALILFIIWPPESKAERLIIKHSSNKMRYFLVTVLISILLLFLFIFSARVLLGQIFFYKFVHSRDRILKTKYIKTARIFDSANAFYWYKEGMQYLKDGNRLPKGQREEKLEMFHKAKYYFEQAIEREPTNWRYQFSQGGIDLAIYGLDKKDFFYNQAMLSINRAIALNPTRFEIFQCLGDYHLRKDLEKACAYYKDMLKLKEYFLDMVIDKLVNFTRNPIIIRKAIPDKPEMLIKGNNLLNLRGIKTDAFYKEAMREAAKGKASNQIAVSEILFNLDKSKEAVDGLFRLIENSRYFKNNSSDFIFSFPSPQELVKFSDESSKRDKNISKASLEELKENALFYYHLEEYNKALISLEKILEIKQDGEIFYKKALIFYKTEEYKNCYQALKQAINLLEDKLCL